MPYITRAAQRFPNYRDARDFSSVNAAYDAIAAAGGGILQLGSYHEISSTLEITDPNVFVRGLGGGKSADVGSTFGTVGTRLKWTGASGGTIVDMYSPSGASAQKMAGGGISGICFDCNNVADFGLKIRSWYSAEFTDLYFYEAEDCGLLVTVQSTLGESPSTHECKFSKIKARNVLGSGDCIRLEGGAAVGAGNTCLNLFEQLAVRHKDGRGLVLGNTDNNLFNRVWVYRGSGTGNAIEFLGSNDGAAFVARANIMTAVTTVAGTVARGTSTYTHPSYNNFIEFLDKDNASPSPTIETGASLSCSRTDGVFGLIDGVTAPSTVAGIAQIYVDTADGDLKVKYGDGTAKVIVADT